MTEQIENLTAKMVKIQYNDHEIIKWIADDGFCCYDARSVCEVLELRNSRRPSALYSCDEIVSPDTRQKYNVVVYKKYKDGVRKDNKMILLTERGLKRLICNTRSPKAAALAEFFGFDIYNNKFVSQEADFISALQKSFPGELLVQWEVPETNYRLDAYMPKFNIAIECDEKGHDYQIAEDIKRQNEITKIIKCSWVRFKSSDPNCDIFATIGEIYCQIKNKQ